MCGDNISCDLTWDQAEKLLRSVDRPVSDQEDRHTLPLHRSQTAQTTGYFKSISDLLQKIAGSFRASTSEQPSGDTDVIVEKPIDEVETNGEKYLHWCVDETRATTRLIDVDVKTVCEKTLISKLVQAYYSVRRWQNWLTLSDCVDVRFVKVRSPSWSLCRVRDLTPAKFGRIYTNQDIIACGPKAFPDPTNPEYEYEPSEPPESTQLILEAELRHHFEKRGRCAGDTYLIPRLPKKVPEKLAARSGIEGYVMHAVNGPSFWRWIVLVILSQLGPAVFFVYWLVLHPKDLQNASVPSILVAGLTKLFRWPTS